MRGRNADGLWGGWRNSPAAAPLATPLLTTGSITTTTARVTIWGHSGNWHYQANWGPHSASCSAAVAGSAADLSGLTYATHYIYTAYSDSQCSTRLASIEFSTSPLYPIPRALAVKPGTLGQETVTLVPVAWFGNYHYKSDKAPHNSGCNGPVANGGSLAVTGLSPNTAYTYTIYDHSDCDTDLAQISFTTAPLPSGLALEISTLVADRVTLAPEGWDRAWHYKKHQDGSAVGGCVGPVGPGAETISTVLLPNTSYTYRVYAYSGCDTSSELGSAAFKVPELAGAPGKNTASLVLLNWSGPWWYRELGVYSSTGDLVGFGGQCRGPVAADGSAVATGLVSGEKYGFQAYSSAASCQDDRDDTSRWLTAGTLGPVAEVATITTVDLDASDVTGTTATLTIDDAVGYWFAKQTAPSAGPCSSAINGTTHILTSLVEGQAHTYKAYNDAGCIDEHELASATFTTMSLAVSGVTGTGATLTITGHTGNWYYQADTGPDSASCQGPVSTAAEALTGLTAGTSYRYTAYRTSGCTPAGELGWEAFTTLKLAATGVTGTGATLTISGRSGNWHYKAGAGPHSTCQGPVGTAATALAGLSPSTSYTYTAYRDSGCANLLATAAAFTTAVSLTAADVAPTSATLVIGGHTAQWWYKANAGPDSSCQGPVAANTSTESLTGLTERRSYTYTAYSQTGCNDTDLLATAGAFNTGGLSVGNSAQSSNGVRQVGWIGGSNKTYAYTTSFTTGTTGSYTLDSVRAWFGASSPSANNLHVYIYTDNNGKPGPQLAYERKDLGGQKPGSHADSAWRCVGANCTLNASTTYWVVMRQNSISGGLGNLSHGWKYTNSGNQANNPSSAGWAIGDTSYRGQQTRAQSYVNQPAITWEGSSISGAGLFKLTVAVSPSLDASDISSSSATLTLSDYEGVWWYQRTSPSGDSTCHRVDGGTAARVAGLSASTSYTYKAYDKPGCASADEIASETFSATTAQAPSLAASAITSTTATLTAANHTGAWHYRADTGPDAACQGPVAAGTATKALSGLTAGTTYTYGAYSDSNCSAQLAAESFTTLTLAAADITNTTATLTLAGHSGAWHHKHTSGGCSSAITHTSATVSGLTPGASYTFSAYRDSGCANLLATAAAFTADALVAGGVDSTGATLTIAGRTGAWHLKQTAPSEGACSSAIAAEAAHSLTALTPGTSYTYTAYSDASCTTAIGVESFTTLPPALTASRITTSAARLTISGHTADWWHKGDQSGSACTSVSANTSTADLTGLDTNTSYTYTAYSDNACSTPIATAPAFATLSASVRNISDTSATLRLANRVGPWFYKATTGPHTTCQGPATGANRLVTGLTPGVTYTYSAYADAACTGANLLATTGAFTTRALTASAITRTTATLTIAGHTGNWWYLSDTSPYTSCYGPFTGAQNLTGLTASTSYTFTAHPEQGCPPNKVLATAVFTTSNTG